MSESYKDPSLPCSTICLVFTRLFICCFLPKPAQAASWSSSNKPSNSCCSDDDTIFFPLKYWQWVPPWSYIHSVLQPPKPKCWNKCPGEQYTASSAKLPPTDQNRQPSINIFTTWVPNKSSNCSTDSWIVILCHPNMEMSRSELSTTLQPNMQEKWRNAKSLWLSQWVFSENNNKWPMFSDTFFSLENRSRKINLLQLPPQTCMKQQFSVGALQ